MIQQTVQRLEPLAPESAMWILTNDLLADEISDQLRSIPRQHILCEPAARNTAPACGLAAFLIERKSPETVIGIFPSDHVVADEPRFLKALQRGIRLAAEGDNIVVCGIQPSHPETGYGYIETGESVGEEVYRVRRFTEKPNLQRAEEFVTAGNYYWNSGIFLWSARTLATAIREHLPEMVPMLEEIAAAFGTPRFEQVFADIYPKCENISVDYALLEPRSAKGEHSSNLYCIPAEFGWNDLGSWASLFKYQQENRQCGDDSGNVTESDGHLSLNAHNNYVYSPQKYVALVGVEDLVVVETDDAILIAHRDFSQDVGKIVKELKENGRSELI
jgi:mannose-1-phosphate guanylyltransferase